MITKYKLYESENIQKFSIPKQLEKYYIIDGDMSNTKNWRSTKYFNKFTLKNDLIESAKYVRYVLISLDSNNIIPINMNDEHHVGYDVLYDVFYDKYKVTRENYVSVCSWGTHYIYHINDPVEKAEQIKVFEKFLDYGGNPKLKIHIYGTEESNRYDYEMTVEQFLKTEGSYKKFEKIYMKGNISEEGLQLIEILTNLKKQYNLYLTSTRTDYIEKNITTLSTKLYKLIVDVYFYKNNKIFQYLFRKFASDIDFNIKANNINKLQDLIFSHDGVENYIHIKLKEKDTDAKEFFWDIKKALIEFNRLSSL